LIKSQSPVILLLAYHSIEGEHIIILIFKLESKVSFNAEKAGWIDVLQHNKSQGRNSNREIIGLGALIILKLTQRKHSRQSTKDKDARIFVLPPFFL